MPPNFWGSQLAPVLSVVSALAETAFLGFRLEAQAGVVWRPK